MTPKQYLNLDPYETGKLSAIGNMYERTFNLDPRDVTRVNTDCYVVRHDGQYMATMYQNYNGEWMLTRVVGESSRSFWWDTAPEWGEGNGHWTPFTR